MRVGELSNDEIGSVLYVQLKGGSFVPMSIITENGQCFSGMEIYKGSADMRCGEDGDPLEIIFFAMGPGIEKGYFRWLKAGEVSQFKSPVNFYIAMNIVKMNIGHGLPQPW